MSPFGANWTLRVPSPACSGVKREPLPESARRDWDPLVAGRGAFRSPGRSPPSACLAHRRSLAQIHPLRPDASPDGEQE